MDIVFVYKKSEEEVKPKTILRVDAVGGLGMCTISQILGVTPEFKEAAPWHDGDVTSVGAIKEWAAEHTEDYDATIFTGKKEYELKDYEGEVEEDEESEKEA